MRIGSIVYNTVPNVNSAFSFKPGTLFVVAGQADNGGLHAIPTFLVGEQMDSLPVLDPGTFHRVDKDLEKTIQKGYELEGKIEDFGTSLPNPNQPAINAAVQQIEEGIGDLTEDEEEYDPDLDHDEDDEEEDF